MPYTDRLGRVCGFLNIEEREDSNQFSRRYFILDTNMGKMSYYMDNPLNLSENCSMPIREFNLQYISQVSDCRKMRPKVLFCFAIHVAGTKYYLQADNDDDIQHWIEALTNASKIQVPSDELISSCTEWRQDDSEDSPYVTEIAGGVVCKLTASKSVGHESGEHSPDTNSSKAPQWIPRVVKEGYCVKQGALRKNWKRRYFILNDDGISYFPSHGVKTAIRSINKRDILDVRFSKSNHTSRENIFEIVTSKRIFYVQTDSLDEGKHWIQCIHSVLKSLHSDERKSVMGVDLLSTTESSHSDNEVSRATGVWSLRRKWTKDGKELNRDKKRSWFLDST